MEMKNFIAIVMCLCMIFGNALAFAESDDQCGPCSKNQKVWLPYGEGGGRSTDPCNNAATQMQKNNKIAEEGAAAIAKATKDQNQNNTDELFTTLMDCVTILNLNILAGIDLSGLALDKILAALKKAACKFAKEQTQNLWRDALAKARINVGGYDIDPLNLNVMGTQVTSTNLGGNQSGNKSPVLISRTPQAKASDIARSTLSNGMRVGGSSSVRLPGSDVYDKVAPYFD